MTIVIAERTEQHTPPLRLDEDDAISEAPIEPEEKDEAKEVATTTTASPGASAGTPHESRLPRKIIRFDDGDPAQPNNWSRVGSRPSLARDAV